MTIQEWLDKAEWEGGVLEAIEYGLTENDLDADVNPKFAALVSELRQLWGERVESLVYAIAKWEVDDDESE